MKEQEILKLIEQAEKENNQEALEQLTSQYIALYGSE
jgi:hypothetical protein